MTVSFPPDASTAPAATRRPLPSAPRVGKAQHLGGRQRTVDAEQMGDLVWVEAGTVVLDEIAALDLADPHRRSGVEAVVGQFLQDQPDEPVRRHASLLL